MSTAVSERRDKSDPAQRVATRRMDHRRRSVSARAGVRSGDGRARREPGDGQAQHYMADARNTELPDKVVQDARITSWTR